MREYEKLVSAKLKCCPLCGDRPKFVEGAITHIIKCDSCGLNLFDRRITALISRWNERTSDGAESKRGFEPVKDAPADTKLPVRGTDKAAGYDFYAPCDIVIPAKGRTENIFLNVKAYMQDDEYLQIKIRSGLAVKHSIVLETSGVIDADYYGNETTDGNISVVFRNNSDSEFIIQKGERCCQGVFMKYLTTDNDESLGSRRGGFGSSGK